MTLDLRDYFVEYKDIKREDIKTVGGVEGRDKYYCELNNGVRIEVSGLDVFQKVKRG